MSVPREKAQRSAATAAAEPDEEPPVTLVVSWGFLVGPKAECSPEPPWANSSQLVLPKRMASASRSFWMAVALTGGL